MIDEKLLLRTQLEKDTAEFLSNGGKITVLDPLATGEKHEYKMKNGHPRAVNKKMAWGRYDRSLSANPGPIQESTDF